jgi:DNA-directed RNA polymerase specialized sigma24 family protein
MEHHDRASEIMFEPARPFTDAEKRELAAMIGRFLDRMKAIGTDLARRYKLPRTLCDGDDVVGGALTRLWRAVEAGKCHPLRTDEDFRRMVVVILNHEALLAQEHFGRHKRIGGGPADRDGGRKARPRRVDVDPDRFDSEDCPPDVRAIADLQVAMILAPLDRSDPLLRPIVLMRMDGFLNQEIAAALEKSPWAVERRLNRIRSLLESHGLASA